MKNEKMTREEIISALNDAISESSLPNVVANASRYDASTGTMYCENKEQYSEAAIKEALDFFRNSEAYYRKADRLPDSESRARFCKIATESILIMLNAK